MKFTAIFIGATPVAVVQETTVLEAQAKLARLNSLSKTAFRAEMHREGKLVAQVFERGVVWIERPDAWDHLLEDDGL